MRPGARERARSVATSFHRLNDGWNAEPNAPAESVQVCGDTVSLEFDLNAFMFNAFSEGDQGRLTFSSCSRYRLGPTNDEGWYRGQCRFSKVAPAWGEFYEVTGDLFDEQVSDWVLTGFRCRPRHQASGAGSCSTSATARSRSMPRIGGSMSSGRDPGPDTERDDDGMGHRGAPQDADDRVRLGRGGSPRTRLLPLGRVRPPPSRRRTHAGCPRPA
jgi:hypothetical protein